MADKTKNPVIGRVGRVKREQQNTRYVIYIASAIIGIILLILVVGAVLEGVIRPGQPVAVVNSEEITTGAYQKRVRLERYLLVNQYLQNLQYLQQFAATSPELAAQFQSQMRVLEIQLDPVTIGRATLDNMIEEALLRQKAGELGISISQEDINRAIEENFGYFPDGVEEPTRTPTTAPTSTFSPLQLSLVTITPTFTEVVVEEPTSEATPQDGSTPESDVEEPQATALEDLPTATTAPTSTPVSTQEFGDVLSVSLDEIYDFARIDEATLNDFFAASLYKEQIFNIVTVDVPALQEQVWARHILVADEETAQEVLDLLAEGENWADLALEFSQDTSNAERGGDLGWFNQTTMVREFTQVAYNTNIGAISQPFQTSFGWHILQVLGHEDRPLSSDQHLQYRLEEFNVWLDELKAASDITEMDYWQARTPDTPAIPAQYRTSALQQQQP